jgi:hypothetical protein
MSIDKQRPEDLDTKGNDHACLVADTLVITESGSLSIQDLCDGNPHQVLSHDGQFHEAYGALTRKKAKIIKITFDDWTYVYCTFDHKFMLDDGTFKEACCLTPDDLIRCVKHDRSVKKIKSLAYPEAPQEVYCLNVPATSTFVLANGVVSHNCDALRYLCKERLLDAAWEQPKEVFNKGLIKLQSYIASIRSQQGRIRI